MRAFSRVLVPCRGGHNRQYVVERCPIATPAAGAFRMSKQTMREEAERLVREAMERKNLVVKQGDTRIETKCGKCGAPNRVTAAKGVARVKFVCKECGHKQETL
jgi:ribosomal protein S14